MADATRFEIRLAEALGRLAELAPTMDDADVARAAIAADRSRGGTGWLASLRRPRASLVPVLIAVGLLLAALLAAIVGGAFRDDPALPVGRNGVIVFTVQDNDHGPAVTHLIEANGTADRVIEAERCPTYSTDGSILAWLSYAGSASLVVAAADGSPIHTVPLVDDATTTVPFALSPDGSRVGWVKPATSASSATTHATELWVAAVAGGAASRVVPASPVADEAYDSPVWSPDGGHLAFVGFLTDPATGERHRSAIYTVAADGSDLRRLTVRPGMLGDGLSWSPDGRFLAYVGRPDPPAQPSDRDVFVIAADGSNERNLTGSPATESDPAWSPDGAFLAFGSSANGNGRRATTIHMNGPNPVATPRTGPESTSSAWSPDSTELLWSEVETLGTETYRTTLHAIDPDFLGPPSTLQAFDGLIPCTPSWQRIAP